MRIDEQSNPSNDSEPARHLRKNLTHSFSWRILCTVQSFHKRRIINDPKIEPLSEQTRPFLRSETVPTGNHLKHIKYACSGRSFYPEDDLISRKRLVFNIFLTF